MINPSLPRAGFSRPFWRA